MEINSDQKSLLTPSQDLLWLFTGQGTLLPGGMRPLYEADSAFQAALNQYTDLLKNHIPISLLPLLIDADPEELLKHTEYAQPAIAALQLAQVFMWQSRGLLPSIVVGHSIGEFAAAVTAGVMAPETALLLAAVRGRLMAACPPGGMLAVFTSVESLKPLLTEEIVIAAENGPSMTVLAGPKEILKKFIEENLKEINHASLPVSHAFHSSAMNSAAEAFRSSIDITLLSKPQNIQFISTLTGNVETNELQTANYWANQITQPVQFLKAVRTAFALNPGPRTIFEIGPSSTLINMAKRFIKDETLDWIASAESLQYTRHLNKSANQEKLSYFTNKSLDSKDRKINNFKRSDPLQNGPKPKRPLFRHVPLHWSKPVIAQESTDISYPSPQDCIYEIHWEPNAKTSPSRPIQTPCLLLSRKVWDSPLPNGWESKFVEHAGSLLSISSSNKWSTVVLVSDGSEGDLELGLTLLQSISEGIKLNTKEVIFLTAAKTHQGAGLWGLARSFRLEHPDVRTFCIAYESHTIREIIHSIAISLEEDDLLLDQQGSLLVPRLRHLEDKLSQPPFQIRPDATYVISGGQGALGLLITKFLVDQGAKYLILLSRTPKPIDSIPELAKLAKRANIECLSCDVSQEENVLKIHHWLTQYKWPPVRGILHTSGVLTDGIIANQSIDKLSAALGPKVKGAIHLRSVFTPPDFFIFFSSAAALFGSPGQASYAAANAILDALAKEWSAAGEPVLSIQWGAWSEAGMALRHQAVKRAEDAGFGSISSDLGMLILEHLFKLGKREVVYASPMNWSRITLPSPMLSPFRKIKKTSLALNNYTKDDLFKIVQQAVEESIGRTVEKDVSLLDNGLDSLGSVSLRNQLAMKLKVQLPAGFLFDHPDIRSIVNYLSTLISEEIPTPAVSFRSSEYPVLVIGAGIGGLNFARQLEKAGSSVVVMEQALYPGGVWKRLANDSSKLQIDSPAYSFDSTSIPKSGDHRWETIFPSKSEVLSTCQQIIDTLSSPIYFNTKVHKIIKVSDVEYDVSYQREGKEEHIRVSGVAALTGGLHHPRNILFPQEDLFEGQIGLGISNDISVSSFKDASVVIIGHGAFAVENMRTALENGAKHVTILCRRKQIVFSTFCNWLINSSKSVLSVTDIVDIMRPFYKACGINIEDLSSLTQDKSGDWMLDQTTVPAGSDLYFLAQMVGKLTVSVDEITSFTPDTIITKNGKRIKADIFIKCLGSDTDNSILKNIFGEESTIQGLWINGDPNLFTYNDGAQVPRKVKSLMCGSYAFFVQAFVPAYLAFRQNRAQFEQALGRINADSSTIPYAERILIELWDFIEPAKQAVAERAKELCPFDRFQQDREKEWDNYIQLMGCNAEKRKTLWYLLQPSLAILQRRQPDRPMEIRNHHPSLGQLSFFMQRRYRVLFLPGQGTNSRLARTLLEQTGWISRSNLDFFIPDAPYEMDAFTNEEQLRQIGLDGLVKTGLYDKTARYREWRAGFEMFFEHYHYGKELQITEEYREQWKKTLEYLKEIIEYYGPFDGIAGFCEGATVASVALHLQARGENYGLHSIRFFIAMSPWRSPLHEQEGLFQSQSPLSIPMLQIVGENDMEVFLAAAPHFQKDFSNSSEFRHIGQHVYPPFTTGLAHKLNQLLYPNNLCIWEESIVPDVSEKK